jgi:hypothetical protein
MSRRVSVLPGALCMSDVIGQSLYWLWRSYSSHSEKSPPYNPTTKSNELPKNQKISSTGNRTLVSRARYAPRSSDKRKS